MLEGGCCCKNVRFRITGLFDCVYCHCSECRKTTGAALPAFAIVEIGKFGIVEGVPQEFRRLNGFHHFCLNCGSNTYYRGDRRPHVSIPIGAFDKPGELQPLAHQGRDDRLPWLRIDDY